MELIFALFLYTGIASEVAELRGRKALRWKQTVYSVLALFFLFWKEAYIIHGFIVALMMISVIRGLMEHYKEWKPEYDRVDAWLSLLLLAGMAFHLLVHFLK